MQEKFWKRRNISRSKTTSPSKSPRRGDLATHKTTYQRKSVFKVMLNSDNDDEVCDATKADSSIKADYI